MILAVWCTYMKGSGNRRIRNSKRILKRGVLKHREILLWLFLLLVLVVLSVMLSGKINSLSKMKKMAAQPVSYKDEVFRCQNFGMDVISEIMQNHNYEAGVRQMFWGKQNNMLNIFNKMDGILIPENDKGRYTQALEVLYRDIRFFPVKQDARQKYGWYYEDSWGDARTYGGTRRHEGTDIMNKSAAAAMEKLMTDFRHKISVHIIARKRMSGKSHMNSDLVRSSRFEVQFNKRCIIKFSFNIPICYRRLNAHFVRTSSQSFCGIGTVNRNIYPAASAQPTFNKCAILFFDFTRKLACRKLIQCTNNHTGSALVKSADGSERRIFSFLRKICRNSVCKRITLMIVRRVHCHKRRFIDNKNIFIFINNIQFGIGSLRCGIIIVGQNNADFVT